MANAEEEFSEAFGWEQRLGEWFKNARDGKNVERDLHTTLHFYKRKYLELESGRQTQVLACAVVPKGLPAERPQRLIQPFEPVQYRPHEEFMNAPARAVLSQLSDKAVLQSGHLDLRERGLTPEIARVFAERMVEQGLAVERIDMSNNKLLIHGFVHLCQGLISLHAMRDVRSIRAAKCGIEFKKPVGGVAERIKANRDEMEVVERLLHGATRLEALDLSQNKLESMGMGVLVRACHGPMATTLTRLGLASADISDTHACASLVHLFKSLHALTSLDLSYNAIRGKEAVVVASGLSSCTSLESINLSHNGFGEASAAEELSRVLLPGTRVRHLDVSFNRLELTATDAQCPALAPHFAVLENFRELLPLVARHEGEYESVTMRRVRESVEEVQAAARREVEAGRVRGSLVKLIGGLRKGAGHAIRSVNLDGNPISRVGEGVVLSLLAMDPFEEDYVVNNVEERLWSKHMSKDVEIKENFTMVTCPVGQSFPLTALRVGGYLVWEVADDRRSIIAEVGSKEFELHEGPPVRVTIVHNVETRFSNLPQPIHFDRLAELGTHAMNVDKTFTPPKQGTHQNELFRRALERSPERQAEQAPSLRRALLHLRDSLEGARGQQENWRGEIAAATSPLRFSVSPAMPSSPASPALNKGKAKGGSNALATPSPAEEAQVFASVGADALSKLREGEELKGASSSVGSFAPTTSTGTLPPSRVHDGVFPGLGVVTDVTGHVLARPGKQGQRQGTHRRKGLDPVLSSQLDSFRRLNSAQSEAGSEKFVLQKSSSRRIMVQKSKKALLPDPLNSLNSTDPKVAERDPASVVQLTDAERLAQASKTLRSAIMRRQGSYREFGVGWQKGRQHLMLKKDLSHLSMIADPEGSDLHYTLHPSLPTYACPERIHTQHVGEAYCGALLPVTGRHGEYEREPSFHGAKRPPVRARLQSLAFVRNMVGLATLAAEAAEDLGFWQAIDSIRAERLTERDSTVSAVIECPATVVIGEPFAFSYAYVGHEHRLTDAYRSDWIGLYQINDTSGGGDVENNTLVARFRPPHGDHAEVQLRHMIWTAGTYQMRMSLVNSDTVIAMSSLVVVKYATATLSCKEEIVSEENSLDLRYVLDYRSLVHPPTDWVGLFPKGERFLTVHHAVLRCEVPAHNLGTIRIDPHGFEGAYQIVYFQEFPDRAVVLGHCECNFIPKPPVAPQKFVKSSKPPSEMRHVKFYISGTFTDLQEERQLIYSRITPRVKTICDARHLSVVFMDMRYGVTGENESVDSTVAINDKSVSSLIERCLMELDSCLPYFICLIGHVYGNVGKALPWRVAQLYPWLLDNRFQNPRVSHGARLSLTEMEIVNAVLIDPSLAPNARFYLRDQSYSLGRGPAFQDTDEWAKIALNFLKTKIRKTVENSEKMNPKKCMLVHSYFHPRHFAELALKDILAIIDMDYQSSHTPSDLTRFWLTQDEAASKHMKKTNVQLRREMLVLDTKCEQIDLFLNEAFELDRPTPLLLIGDRGAGLTTLMVRWTQRRISNSPLLFETNDIRDKASSFVQYTDPWGREALLMVFYIGIHQRLRKPSDLLRVLLQSIVHHCSLPLDSDDLLDERVGAAVYACLAATKEKGLYPIIVLDGLDQLGGGLPLEAWLPDTKALKHVHWLATTCDPAHGKALVARDWDAQSLNVEQWDEDFREGLMQSVIKRHKPSVYREHIELLKAAPLHMYPEFLSMAMDALRTCTHDRGASMKLTEWCCVFEDVTTLHVAVMRKWCCEVPGAQDLLSLLALAETGLYEHELMDLLGVPTSLSCSNWQDLLTTVDECTFVCCGIRTFFSRRLADAFSEKLLTKEQRGQALQTMKAFFQGMHTCNRKVSELPHVLEKCRDSVGLYAYITNVDIFCIMWRDALHKQQFLEYITRMRKTTAQVQQTLRLNFEHHFKLTRRWFSDAFNSLQGGAVMFYELNPIIYRSDKDLLYFVDAVYYMSSYFELYGQHLDCIRDLEASLKALYGASDLFSIPKLNADGCRFPARVSRILRRLCRLYALHLSALLNHWLVLDHEGLPKHEVPPHMEAVDVSWWTTLVPEGHARTLPRKLKVVYVLARTLAGDKRTRDANVEEVVVDEDVNGHLADYVWNSGLKQFVHQPFDSTLVPYGRCSKNTATLQSLPAVVNYSLPVVTRVARAARESTDEWLVLGGEQEEEGRAGEEGSEGASSPSRDVTTPGTDARSASESAGGSLPTSPDPSWPSTGADSLEGKRKAAVVTMAKGRRGSLATGIKSSHFAVLALASTAVKIMPFELEEQDTVLNWDGSEL